MLRYMLRFFKRKPVIITGDVGESDMNITHTNMVMEKEIQIPKTKPTVEPTPKENRRAKQFVKFNSIIDNIQHEAVILKTVEYEKAKDESTRFIHIVTVFKKDGKDITPYLKWINKSYCTPITKRNIKHIDKQYFNYDWMVENGKKKKRVKRDRTERTL